VSCTSEILDRPHLPVLDQSIDLAATVPGAMAPLALDLLSELQKTLEPEAVLEIFADRLRQMATFGGLRFTSSTQDKVVNIGRTDGYAATFALQAEGVDLGNLVLYTDDLLSDGQGSVVSGLVQYLVFPLRNAVDYQGVMVRAMCDPLTGLGNRASFDADMSRELCRAERQGQSMSLIIFDVDRFKLINDTWGHQVGDRALKRLARCARESIRDMDMVFRFAGDEFAVILPGAKQGEASKVAERILCCVNRLAGDLPRDAMSVSLGVAGWTPGMTADDLFAAADRALYQAKRQGRARVSVAFVEAPCSVAV